MSSIECVDVSTFIGRELTTVLKIAVDNVNLKLSDACDYFARPLLVFKKKKKQLNLISTFRKETCKLLKVLLSYRSYP